MTRKELAARIDLFERSNRRWEWPFVCIYIGGLILIAIMFARLDDNSELFNWIAMGVLVLWVGGPIPILLKINRKRIKELGLECPSCSISLAGGIGRLTVASLYCCKCGEKILDGEETNQGEQADGGNQIQR